MSQESKETKLASRAAKLNTEIENMIVVGYLILNNINEKSLLNNCLLEVKSFTGASNEKINEEILLESKLNKVIVHASTK